MKYKELLDRLVKLGARLDFLEKENKYLKQRLAFYENPKNNRNSSIPPTQDPNRPKANQSLRKSSGKKLGGQKGRTGKTLEMTASPDKVVELQPQYCTNCGNTLENLQASKEQSRQIVDIPPIKAVFTEYQTFSKQCPCGCKTVANFPKKVNAPISYGTTIEALTAYFHARQYLPFARMQEVFKDVFNIDISEGGIHYLLNRFADKTHKKLYTFYKRMCRERQHLMVFLFLEEVQPDNNASEGAIRNVKVKQKVSGQFKKQETAQNFSKIRTIMDTTIKNGMNVLKSLTLIAKFEFQFTD